MARCAGEVYLLDDGAFGSADKIVEHVLLLQLHSGFMPLLTVFRAATHVHRK